MLGVLAAADGVEENGCLDLLVAKANACGEATDD
jgi:hypothetical protein